MKIEIAISGMIIFIAALFVIYVVFAGGTLAGFVITGTNPDANFIAFVLGLAGLLVGCVMAFFGFAFHPPQTK